jgi:hypothetical protein
VEDGEDQHQRRGVGDVILQIDGLTVALPVCLVNKAKCKLSERADGDRAFQYRLQHSIAQPVQDGTA